MRLCVLTPLWPSRDPDSGIANNLACQARALAARGHEVQVLHLSHHRPVAAPVQVYEDNGLRIREVPTGRYGRGGDLLRRLLAPWQAFAELRRIDGEIDGIVTTSYEYAALPYTLFRRRVPVLTRVSTTLESLAGLSDLPGWRWRHAVPAWLERVAVRVSPLLCTHTRAHIDYCSRQMGVPADRFLLIPHGIEMAPAAAETWSAPRTILFVGRMGQRKGTDVLLAAAPRVLRAHPDCRFELVGSDLEGLGKRFSAEHPDLVAQVVFRGQLGNRERDDAIARCYLFVSPSPYESFGLTFLEAMIAGKPVVGCSGSGAAELIGDAGVTVAPGDAGALADVIAGLLANQARRDHLARLAAVRAREFSIEATACRIEEAFRRAP